MGGTRHRVLLGAGAPQREGHVQGLERVAELVQRLQQQRRVAAARDQDEDGLAGRQPAAAAGERRDAVEELGG